MNKIFQALLSLGLLVSFGAAAGGKMHLDCRLEKMTKDEVIVQDDLKRSIRIKRKGLSEADIQLLKTSTKDKLVKLEVDSSAFSPGQTIKGSR